MHSFLKSIGFGNIISRSDEEQLIKLVMENVSERQVFQVSENRSFVELYMEVAEETGIIVRGEQDGTGKLYISHYVPIHRGLTVATEETVFINKRVDTDAFTGMCDDYRIGISLIFYIQNVIDMLKYPVGQRGNKNCPIFLSALATEGKILLPVEKTKIEEEKIKMDLQHRSNLIAEAKQGNQEAIQSLTFGDIDQYAIISRRVRKEDIYSIVETSFIPFGSESDNYSILGYIMDVKKCENFYTKESFYILSLMCNEIYFDVCVHAEDLLGEPMVGRRFRGNVWLQGKVDI